MTGAHSLLPWGPCPPLQTQLPPFPSCSSCISHTPLPLCPSNTPSAFPPPSCSLILKLFPQPNSWLLMIQVMAQTSRPSPYLSSQLPPPHCLHHLYPCLYTITGIDFLHFCHFLKFLLVSVFMCRYFLSVPQGQWLCLTHHCIRKPDSR